MTKNSPRGGGARTALGLTACAALLIVFGASTVRYVAVDLPSQIARRVTRSAADSAREIAAQVAAAFQVRPRVVVGRTTVVEQRTEVLRLVTLEQTLTERQRVEESWLLSTKTLEIEADFVVRAGFDLAQPFVIEIDPSSGALRVTLPPAKILSVDGQAVRFLKDESGLWNPLTGEDRERALRELRLRVAIRAHGGDLLAQARTSAERRLTALLARDGRAVLFTGEKPPLP